MKRPAANPFDFAEAVPAAGPATSRRKPWSPWLIVAAIAGPIVVAVAGLAVALLLLRQAFNRGADAAASGQYPAPVSRYSGQAADEWVREACDMDLFHCQRGCKALGALRREGVPYLLQALGEQNDRWTGHGTVLEEQRVASCLDSLDGSLLDPADAGKLLPLLAQRWATTDSSCGGRAEDDDGYKVIPEFEEQGLRPIRFMALYVLERAGPRAAPTLPALAAMQTKDASEFQAALAHTVRVIQGR